MLFVNRNKYVRYVVGIDDAALATIIGAGISAAASGGTAIANSQLNKKNRAWQEKMYSQQLADQRADTAVARAWQEEQLRKQNVYSSPENTVKLLKEAGLNPALSYGNNVSGATTSVAGGQATQAAPTPGTPHVEGYDFSGIGQAMGEMASGMLGVSQQHLNDLAVQADVSLKKSQELKNLADANLAGSQAKLSDVERQFKESTMSQRISLIDTQVEKAKTEIAVATYNLNRFMPAQASLLDAQVNKVLNDIMTSAYERAKLSSETDLNYEKKKFLTEDTERVRLDNSLFSLRSSFMSLENEYRAQMVAYSKQLENTAASEEDKNKAQTALLETQQKYYALYGTWERITGTLSTLGVTVGTGAGAFKVIKDLNLFKKVPKIGFKGVGPLFTPGTVPRYEYDFINPDDYAM